MSSSPSAVFFHPDAVEAPDQPVIGRRAAGTGFLRAYMTYAPGDEVQAVTQTRPHAERLRELADQLGCERPLRIYCINAGDDFTQAGTIFLPDPSFQDLPWRRQRMNPRGCSFVSITHSVSTQRVASSLREMILAPTEPWDAIICTSRSAKSVLQTQLDLYGSYFSQRFQAGRMPIPQLPVIPLGINPEQFMHPESRNSIRRMYGAEAGDVVLLSVGRMSSVEKAHPIPLFQAAQNMAKRMRQPVKLWMFGWAARPEEQAVFEKGAADLCPAVDVTFIDGNDPVLRKTIWSGADIFTLPSDSLQETFGLVPVEAMAAGLPTVMPDWDGIRDTVRHGETGYLVPTRMTRPGGGQNLADRYFTGTDSYLQYLSLAQQQVAIDQGAYTEALVTLGRDPDLRAKMGAAGQQLIMDEFHWRRVIARYVDLADTLAQRRNADAVSSPAFRRGPPAPEAVDPFTLFASYPSQTLQPSTMIEAPRPITEADLDRWDTYSGRLDYGRWIAPNGLVAEIASHIHYNGPVSFETLCLSLDVADYVLEGIVLLLAKFNLVTLKDR